MGKYNADKLKANLRMAITRLNLVKNKRGNAIAAKKDEVANYLRTGNEEMALINVETIIAHENFISACEILGIMCTQCSERIRVISEFSEPPRDMLASMHTLIYAEPYSECQELVVVKEMLGYRYGQGFVTSAMKNTEGHVNSTVMAKLATTIPDEDLKVRKLEEIAAERHVEYTPRQTFLAVQSTQSLDAGLAPQAVVPSRASEQPSAPIRFPTLASIAREPPSASPPNPDFSAYPSVPSDSAIPPGFSPSPAGAFPPSNPFYPGSQGGYEQRGQPPAFPDPFSQQASQFSPAFQFPPAASPEDAPLFPSASPSPPQFPVPSNLSEEDDLAALRARFARINGSS